MMRSVGKEALLDALGKREGRVYVPVKEGAYYVFREFSSDAEPDFSFQNVRISPKGLIQPQCENLMTFKAGRGEDSGELKAVERPVVPQTVVGIRPCDAQAVTLAKRNFVSERYTDTYWLSRYEATTFVGMACNKPCASCFCTSVGGGPFSETGLDALLVDLGDSFAVKVLTPKGEDFAGNLGAETGGLEDKVAALKSEAENKIVSHAPTDRLASRSVMELYTAPFWEEVAFACINCGVCTFLCPTCWCFDIQDEVSGENGIRMRNWDACMFPLFTLHGSGHNPRSAKLARVRQRFMHKLKYYVDVYGNGVACVGCGRCVQGCPVNIDIRRVMELMNGVEV